MGTMGKAIWLGVRFPRGHPKSADQIETLCSPDPMMRRPRVDSGANRVIHGNDHGGNLLSEETA